MNVSVVIPIYNVSAYIERCIRSVMSQTYSNFECILVDDASPDDSMSKCEQMIATYQGSISFRILHHQQNRGLSAARNTGTDEATGDYILYIDSDDAISNDCIEKLMAPIQNDSTIDMVIGGIKIIPAKKTKRRKRKLDCKDFSGLESVRNYFYAKKRKTLPVWNSLIRKDFIYCFGLSFKEGIIWEDVLWSFYLVKHLSHLYIVKDITYYYFKRSNSISTGTSIVDKRFNWGIVYNEISNNFTPGDCNREAKNYVIQFCKNYIDCPPTELFEETAQNFRKELSFKKDPIEYSILIASSILSKSWICRSFFHNLRKVQKEVRAKWGGLLTMIVWIFELRA